MIYGKDSDLLAVEMFCAEGKVAKNRVIFRSVVILHCGPV